MLALAGQFAAVTPVAADCQPPPPDAIAGPTCGAPAAELPATGQLAIQPAADGASPSSASAQFPSLLAPGLQVDPGLGEAWALLTRVENFGPLVRDSLAPAGLVLTYGALPPYVQAQFDNRANRIVVSNELRGESPQAQAVVIAHEATHALDALSGAGVNHDCVGLEVRAYRNAALVHYQLWYKQRGPERTALERGHNTLTTFYLEQGDPGLYRYVVSSSGYQAQCGLWTP